MSVNNWGDRKPRPAFLSLLLPRRKARPDQVLECVGAGVSTGQANQLYGLFLEDLEHKKSEGGGK